MADVTFSIYSFSIKTLRLIAVLTFEVIHGASLSLQVIVLLGMCLAIIPKKTSLKRRVFFTDI